ncbi:hypothetical protein [Helicobacter canis]|uniref:hypothetical protein n=1 Tax=Helicobacter canis TaxID=29419 RepID=UPI000427C484|nr:hypothetical protein [Helicobacter canis]
MWVGSKSVGVKNVGGSVKVWAVKKVWAAVKSRSVKARRKPNKASAKAKQKPSKSQASPYACALV